MSSCIYVAGASSRARTTREYIEYLYPDAVVRAFLVSPDMTDNDFTVDGIPVLPIAADQEIDVTGKVYVGTRAISHKKIISELVGVGFSLTAIIPVTPDVDTKLRNDYVRRKKKKAGRSFIKFEDIIGSIEDAGCISRLGVCIYEVSSINDGELSDPYIPLKEERLLQVGAALTDKRLSEGVLTDDSGDNISEMNRQFCELTGLYHIWKNATEDIVGLVHYRRHFLLPDNWAEVFERSCVDVILPVPLCVIHSIEENYRARHISADWDNMMDCLKRLYPEDHERAADFFKTGLYSPCNMLIARRRVLDELCTWLFPILFETVLGSGEHEDAYQNRYPGFLSERLITYFFESRSDRYKVVYADKNFLN